MSPSIDFITVGDPVAQGSMMAMISRTTGRAMVIPSNKPGLTKWRKGIATSAERAGVELIPAGVPVTVSFTFILAKPATVPAERMGKPSVYPDLDKLARAAMDALTGTAYKDDGQVVKMEIEKRYCKPGEIPHARISVQRVVNTEGIQASLVS